MIQIKFTKCKFHSVHFTGIQLKSRKKFKIDGFFASGNTVFVKQFWRENSNCFLANKITLNFRAKINLKMTKHFWRENSNYFLKIKLLWIFPPKIFFKSRWQRMFKSLASSALRASFSSFFGHLYTLWAAGTFWKWK